MGKGKKGSGGDKYTHIHTANPTARESDDRLFSCNRIHYISLLLYECLLSDVQQKLLQWRLQDLNVRLREQQLE